MGWKSAKEESTGRAVREEALLSLLMTLGCWNTDIPEEDYSIVPFVNDYVGAQDAIVEKVETDFSCPDGEPAIFYAVYDRALQGSDTLAPMVLVLGKEPFF